MPPATTAVPPIKQATAGPSTRPSVEWPIRPTAPADANLDDQAEYEQLDGGCQRLKAPERQHACHDHDESRRDGRRQNRRHLAEPPHEVRRSGQWREIVGSTPTPCLLRRIDQVTIRAEIASYQSG